MNTSTGAVLFLRRGRGSWSAGTAMRVVGSREDDPDVLAVRPRCSPDAATILVPLEDLVERRPRHRTLETSPPPDTAERRMAAARAIASQLVDVVEQVRERLRTAHAAGVQTAVGYRSWSGFARAVFGSDRLLPGAAR